ncbi:receptor-type protein kinase, putative, partial [Bodo saltans]
MMSYECALDEVVNAAPTVGVNNGHPHAIKRRARYQRRLMLLRMQHLDLSRSCNHDVTAAGLGRLFILSQLRRLEMRGMSLEASFVFRVTPSLTHLHVIFCGHVVDADMSSLHHLQYLKLGGCTKLTRFHLSNISALTHLDISFCRDMTDVSLLSVSTLPQLQRLALSNCGSITGSSLCHNITTLTHLDVSDCKMVTDQGLSGLSALVQL